MRAFSYQEPSQGILIDRRSLLGCVGALIAGPCMISSGRAADRGDPTVPIRQLDTALLAAMKAGRNAPFRQRYEILSPAVEQAFDLIAVLHATVGPDWNRLPIDQQAALASVFRRYTVTNYAANFDSYEGQNFRVLSETRQLPNRDVVVRTQIVRPGGSSIEIDYLMRQTAEDWKAVDVLSDGKISQVAVQRSDFRELLARGGAPALQAGLQRKLAALGGLA